MKILDINWDYYKYFYYVATYGSISQAAEILNISQPAVSQALKNLESSLGGKLFLRTSRGVKLTPEGEMLYTHITKGYENIATGEEIFNRLINLDRGEITVGASDMTLKYFLLPYLEKFHAMYPDIKIMVTNGPTPETITKLAEGKIDFGIVSTPFSENATLTSINAKEIKTVFVAGNKYEYLKDKTLDLNMLTTVPVISLEGNTSTRKYIDEFLNAHGVNVMPEFELATSDMIVQFALRNLGIGCVTYDFAKPFIESGELFQLKFEEEMPHRYFAVITDTRNTISSAAKKLLELIL